MLKEKQLYGGQVVFLYAVSQLVGFSIFINGPDAKSKPVLVKIINNTWWGDIDKVTEGNWVMVLQTCLLQQDMRAREKVWDETLYMYKIMKYKPKH